MDPDLTIDESGTSLPSAAELAATGAPRTLLHNGETHMLKHHEHKCIVGASLTQFARDVLVPTMTADTRSVWTTEVETRLILGCMLLLREVLMQNAKENFGPSSLLTGSEHDMGWEQDETEDDDTTEGFAHDAFVLSARILSTAIVLSALEALPTELSQPLTVGFIRTVDMYDDGDTEFVRYLQPVDGSVNAVLANDEPLDKEEQVTWRSSFNLNREQHPLILARKKRLAGESPIYSGNVTLRMPEPNAAHVTIVEQQRR